MKTPRTKFLALTALLLAASVSAAAFTRPVGVAETGRAGTRPETAKPVITVYKDPRCSCCRNWIAYLEKHGYRVDAKDSPDMAGVKRSLGVPEGLTACHTAVVGGYLIEGHVSAGDIDRLLAERPKVAGLAVPGMPASSPGMDGPRTKAYQVLAFDKDGRTKVFSTH
ncbi:MAG: DUF411 domain-containing protein [Gemmatimonadaceae bacterium]